MRLIIVLLSSTAVPCSALSCRRQLHSHKSLVDHFAVTQTNKQPRKKPSQTKIYNLQLIKRRRTKIDCLFVWREILAFGRFVSFCVSNWSRTFWQRLNNFELRKVKKKWALWYFQSAQTLSVNFFEPRGVSITFSHVTDSMHFAVSFSSHNHLVTIAIHLFALRFRQVHRRWQWTQLSLCFVDETLSLRRCDNLAK